MTITIWRKTKMMNIRDIFKNKEVTAESAQAEVVADSDRKMYCPCCYKDYYTDSDKCPVCGCELEEPLTEEEADEYAEMMMSTRF
jgi:DNA repair exonuclease SbcCD ATPase subunit